MYFIRIPSWRLSSWAMHKDRANHSRAVLHQNSSMIVQTTSLRGSPNRSWTFSNFVPRSHRPKFRSEFPSLSLSPSPQLKRGPGWRTPGSRWRGQASVKIARDPSRSSQGEWRKGRKEEGDSMIARGSGELVKSSRTNYRSILGPMSALPFDPPESFGTGNEQIVVQQTASWIFYEKS